MECKIFYLPIHAYSKYNVEHLALMLKNGVGFAHQ